MKRFRYIYVSDEELVENMKLAGKVFTRLVDKSGNDLYSFGNPTKAAGRSVRFYSYDQLHKYFDKGAVARGCYN